MSEVFLYNGVERPDFLIPVLKMWQKEVKNFELDMNIEIFLDELLKEIKGNFSLILLTEGDIVTGFMGLRYEQSPIGSDKIASEHYWYVMPEYRTIGSMKLLSAAKELAEKNECSHLIITASNLASAMHDKVCGFLEKIKMKKFETSYITDLRKQ